MNRAVQYRSAHSFLDEFAHQAEIEKQIYILLKKTNFLKKIQNDKKCHRFATGYLVYNEHLKTRRSLPLSLLITLNH